MADDKKILIVDDEDTIREVLDQAFSRAGYCVRLATSADEALDILQNEYIPVIFLDISLKKMNGFELCEIIRKDNPSAFIYALSGNTEFFGPHKTRGAGFDDYFTKPVSINILYEVAKNSFDKIEQLANKSLS